MSKKLFIPQAAMSQIDSDISVSNGDSNRISDDSINKLHLLLSTNQQVHEEKRSLSRAEENIIETINTCFRNWYDKWINTFLSNSREFKIVYDLMEGLLHYEYQITKSDSSLTDDRTNAIARAVARLVDYGNAILGIDLIIRYNDETSSEIDPAQVTTIELYQAHIRAHKLRDKLLYDYFKKEKPNLSFSAHPADEVSIQSVSALTTLQLPSTLTVNISPKLERRHRISVGSNTSVNTIYQDGRKTPQQVSPSSPTIPSQIEFKVSPTDSAYQVEIAHMKATIKSSTFSGAQNSKSRLTLLPEILSKIEELLTVPTTTEKIVNCFDLLDTLLDTIERLPNESRNKEVVLISTRLMKPIVRKVYIDDRNNLVEFQQAHWTTCLLSMIRLMTASEFNAYLKHFSNLADLGAFLKDYLFIVKRLVSTNDKTTNATPDLDCTTLLQTYPEYWIEMILLACSAFLTSLTYLYQVLRQLFASNLQMWLSFIDCLIHIILQDVLKPDRFMLKKRQNLFAEDLRQTSAEYVWISWDSLSHDNKKQLLEDMIEPLLRASITLHTKQRSILLPIFYDMMRCDYTSQYAPQRLSSGGSTSIQSGQFYLKQSSFNSDDDLESLPPVNQSYKSKIDNSMQYVNRQMSEDGTVLTRFTHLIIGKLNALMLESDFGDDVFKDELCAAISGDLNPKYYDCKTMDSTNDTGRFRSMARHTSDLIAEFIQICLDCRQANKLSYKHLYLLCLFRLVLFFRDKVDRVELYLNNLYKLFYTHHTAGRYVEAGYTLLEHAKTLPWDNRPLENHFRIVTRFFQTSQQLTDYSSLKSFLYNTIIEYFDQGQLWEAAIPLCRELVGLYQYKTFEYCKLAETLQKMANYFSSITDLTRRNNPEYFRVTFFGAGFPACLRNTTMVYRGKPYEKLGDFQVLMLNKYPDSKLLNSLARPDESLLKEPDAKYLQINACSPLVDLKSKFSGTNLSNVAEFVLNYYRYNECDKFHFSRRISRPSRFGDSQVPLDMDNFANMWRERTTLTTNTLPGILPFFQVFLIETSTVSPIESAIEDLERTNDRLSCMVNRFKADKRQVEDVRLLGQLLLGIVDAAVNGGIAKYETAFFGSSTETSNFDALQTSKQSDMHYKHQPTNMHHHEHLVNEQANIAQVDKLKSLIAHQVPLLDEAIRLHRDRVADVMRPQHEHLEASYKKLKHHIMSKYSRFLPSDYSRSTIRSYRSSLARSPNRSIRSESRLLFMMPSVSRSSVKRMSDVGTATTSMAQKNIIHDLPQNDSSSEVESTNIPYKQLSNDRRSLPSLTTDTLTGCSEDVPRGGRAVNDGCLSSTTLEPSFVSSESNCSGANSQKLKQEGEHDQETYSSHELSAPWKQVENIRLNEEKTLDASKMFHDRLQVVDGSSQMIMESNQSKWTNKFDFHSDQMKESTKEENVESSLVSL